jgi:hypothetical protein
LRPPRPSEIVGDVGERDHLPGRSAEAKREPEPSATSRDVLPVQALGRAIGNRALTRLIQRSLVRDHDVTEGKFKLNLVTDSVGGTTGLRGTIKFKPGPAAPDSTRIRLLQVVRTEDLAAGTELAWSGAEAGRNSVRTTADATRGIEGGWFVDHSAAAARRRTTLADPATSAYYRDYWPNGTMSQEGSKAGAAISEASLADRPASGARIRFSFETVAKATDTGHVYGSVLWGFTVDDPAHGTLSDERSVGRNVPQATTDEALRVFDEYYRNPGATTAPTT